MNPSLAIGNTKNGNYAGNAVLWAVGSTDATGNLLESLSYDACSVKLGFCEHSETKALVEPISLHAMQREGRRRTPTNWADYNVTSTLFDRGFTGHSLSREEGNGKHLPQFGLINPAALRLRKPSIC